MRSFLRNWLLGIAVLAFTVGALFAQLPHTSRLILKDGSYQLATKWQVSGDRVRYYSSEREEWEELPNSLVDWPATNKYNQELKSGALAAEQQQQVSTEDAADLAAEAALRPQILPGLRLPDSGGVYLLDRFQNKPELVELVQSGGDLHKNMGRNILRAAINPIATSKQSIELPGARARVQAHETEPPIYVDVKEDDDNSAADGSSAANQPPPPAIENRYRIVHMKPKKDSRVVGNLKIAFYGKVSQEENWVPVQVSSVSSDWVKVTPLKPLDAGEYALVEMLAKNQINLYVWDFGMDPDAPENPPTWVPVQPKNLPAGTDATPILDQRPH